MNSCILILLLLFGCKGSNCVSNDKRCEDVGCDNDRREKRREDRCGCEHDGYDDHDRRGSSWKEFSNYGRKDAYDCECNDDSYNHNDCCGCDNN